MHEGHPMALKTNKQINKQKLLFMTFLSRIRNFLSRNSPNNLIELTEKLHLS